MSEAPPTSSFGRVLVGAAVVGAIALAIAMLLLWPRNDVPTDPDLSLDLVRASVIEGDEGGCDQVSGQEVVPEPSTTRCKRVTFALDDPAGSTVTFDVPVRSPILDAEEGDGVVLERPRTPSETFHIYDRDRIGSLLWLALAFAVIVVLLGRLRGFAALVGLILSLGVLL